MINLQSPILPLAILRKHKFVGIEEENTIAVRSEYSLELRLF